MPVDILMPALSPTMEEGTLTKWQVKPGDDVSAGDVIAEIETDKATMEVEAVDEGTLAKILVEEGTEGVKVNAVIALLAEEGERRRSRAKGPWTNPRLRRLTALPPESDRSEAREPMSSQSKPRPPRRRPRNSPAPADPEIPEGTQNSPTLRCATPCATPWPKRCAGTSGSS